MKMGSHHLFSKNQTKISPITSMVLIRRAGEVVHHVEEEHSDILIN